MLSAYDKLDTRPGLQNIANTKRELIPPLMEFTVYLDRQTLNTYYSNEYLIKKLNGATKENVELWECIK